MGKIKLSRDIRLFDLLVLLILALIAFYLWNKYIEEQIVHSSIEQVSENQLKIEDKIDYIYESVKKDNSKINYIYESLIDFDLECVD
jgi:hypothetical protein